MDSPPKAPQALRKSTALPFDEPYDAQLVSDSEQDPLHAATNVLDLSSDDGIFSDGPEDSLYPGLPRAQLHELNQRLLQESIQRRPLVDKVMPISELRKEYQDGSESRSFLKQIDWLQKEGYAIRRTKGDGDCFYRSLAFAYVESLMCNPNQELAVATSLSKLQSTLEMLDKIGAEKVGYEDFYDVLVKLLENIVQPDKNGLILTRDSLLAKFQKDIISGSIVMYLRLLTSAQIHLHREHYAGFVQNVDFKTFCEEIQVLGKEADHAEIQALCEALELNVEVAYVTGTTDGPVAFIEFGSKREGVTPLVLVYRPGHYDILVKSHT